MFDNFHKFSTLPHGASSSFVTLIPKINGAAELKDYRPISLIGCIYKIIAKCLSNRLRTVIGEVIGPEQSAFVKDRQILDNFMVANELIHSIRNSDHGGYMFKADFQKAFDTVSWNYLDSVLDSMNFGAKWRSWIKTCVQSAKISFLINGSPSPEIVPSRGLRQGDPLSPFLYIIASEGLSGIINRASSLGMFKGWDIHSHHSPNVTVNISHLQYADDTLFFMEASTESVVTLKRLLWIFTAASGLKINFFKSGLFGVNVPPDLVRISASRIRCLFMKLPVIYLGLPLGASPNHVATWNSVVQKFNNALAGWKSNSLSLAGRLVMIKSVLASLPIYYFSLFKAPRTVVLSLEKIIRRFLWGGSDFKSSLPKISWDLACAHKSVGGLGISNLSYANEGLLFKWVWKLSLQSAELWKQVVRSKYQLGKGIIPSIRMDSKLSKIWRDIASVSISDSFSNNWRISLGNGSLCSFWEDKWAADVPLKNIFPRLFSVAADPDCLVSNSGFWIGNCWRWKVSWRRQLRMWECDSARDLYAAIEHLAPSFHRPDKCIWSKIVSGDYTVNSVRWRTPIPDQLSSCPSHILAAILKVTFVPPKVTLMVWLAAQNRIASRDFLARRHIIPLSANLCPFCRDQIEDANHILLLCHRAYWLWSAVSAWWGCYFCLPNTFQDLLGQWIGLVRGKLQTRFWTILFMSVAWTLWLSRNNFVFKAQLDSLHSLLTLVFNRAHFWISSMKEFDCMKSKSSLSKTVSLKHHNCGLSQASFRSWAPPPALKIKWNTDGSSRGKPGPSGAGGVLRNDKGEVLCIFSCPLHIMESNEAELHAVWLALDFSFLYIRDLRKSVVFELDSANCVTWLSSQSAPRPWKLSHLFNKIDNMLESLTGFEFVHVPRSCNSFADSLAKQGVERSCNFIAWL